MIKQILKKVTINEKEVIVNGEKIDKNDFLSYILRYLFYDNLSIIEEEKENYKVIQMPLFKITKWEEIVNSLYGKIEEPPFLKNLLNKREIAKYHNTIRKIIQEKGIFPLSIYHELGTLFEFLNGYKEGSYYTPFPVILFMVKETLNDYLIGEFDENGKRLHFLETIENNDIRNKIVSLKILEPSMGTGFFVIGIIEYLTYLRWKTNIDPPDIEKQDIKKLRQLFDIEYSIKEGITIHKKHYYYTERDYRLLHEWIFKTKKSILTNNIFGIDINQKAIETAKNILYLYLLQHIVYNPSLHFDNLKMNFIIGDTLSTSFTDMEKIEITAKIRQRMKILKELSENETRDNLREQRKNIYNLLKIEKDKLLWDIEFPSLLEIEKHTIRSKKFDVIIGNPPYGIRVKKNKYHKYVSFGKSKSTDIYLLFTEFATKNLASKGTFSYILNMGVISTLQAENVHKILIENFEYLFLTSFPMRPKPVFPKAEIPVSIIWAINKNNKNKFVFSSSPSLITNDILDVLIPLQKDRNTENKYVDVKNLIIPSPYIKGRIPKIGSRTEKQILEKIIGELGNSSFFYLKRKKLKDFFDENGDIIQYKSSGGRYYLFFLYHINTQSTNVKNLKVCSKYRNVIGSLLSSNLFFWWWVIWSNLHDTPYYIIESFPLFDLNNLSNTDKQKIDELYKEYNKVVSNLQTQRKDKAYNLRNASPLIKQFDDILLPYYNLTPEEIKFIKNYWKIVRE